MVIRPVTTKTLIVLYEPPYEVTTKKMMQRIYIYMILAASATISDANDESIVKTLVLL